MSQFPARNTIDNQTRWKSAIKSRANRISFNLLVSSQTVDSSPHLAIKKFGLKRRNAKALWQQICFLSHKLTERERVMVRYTRNGLLLAAWFLLESKAAVIAASEVSTNSKGINSDNLPKGVEKETFCNLNKTKGPRKHYFLASEQKNLLIIYPFRLKKEGGTLTEVYQWLVNQHKFDQESKHGTPVGNHCIILLKKMCFLRGGEGGLDQQ